MPGALIYAAAENSIDGITKVLSKKLGPGGIRANSVNPVLTSMEFGSSAAYAGFGGQLVAALDARGTCRGRTAPRWGVPGCLRSQVRANDVWARFMISLTLCTLLSRRSF